MEPTVDLKQAHQLEIEHLRRHAAQLESSENVALPLQEFHRENREQEYYKELHRLSGNFLESHIGVRVTRLSREQVLWEGGVTGSYNESLRMLKKVVKLVRWPGILLSLLDLLDKLFSQYTLCLFRHAQI
jgi:hypothetical protein